MNKENVKRAIILILISFFSLFAKLNCGSSVQAQDGTYLIAQNGGIPVITKQPNNPQLIRVSSGLTTPYILTGNYQDIAVVVEIDPVYTPTVVTRVPIAVSLVIDRSGSMSGEKIEHAKTAAISFLEQLRDGDMVSLVIYDTVVEQILPPTIVNAQTRSQFIMAVNQIYARGSTNMFGGLQTGIQNLTSWAGQFSLKRVILISDGLANVGPSSPMELGNLAAQSSEFGISVTSIGVGTDYDERTLGEVTMRSGGRFYHLLNTSQLAYILQQESQYMASTVAKGVALIVQLSPGVQILDILGGYRQNNGQNIIIVGDVFSGRSREIVLQIRVPAQQIGRRNLGNITVNYQHPTSQQQYSNNLALFYNVTAVSSEVNQNTDNRRLAIATNMEVADAQLRASQLTSQGRQQEAQQVLSQTTQHAQSISNQIGSSTTEGEALSRRVSSANSQAGNLQSAPASREEVLEMNADAMGGLGY